MSKSAQNLAFSLNNLTAGREFSKISRIHFKPPKKNPTLPKSSDALVFNRRGSGNDAAASFAARLRQPCGGEGSEGRALAIPRASGAGWAGAWVARPSRRDRPPPNHPRADGLGPASELQRRRAGLHQHKGATIAAETAAPRGCWPRDPRSGGAMERRRLERRRR